MNTVHATAIRAAFAQVSELRAKTSAQPALRDAVLAVKSLQGQRFASTYADELRGGRFEAATRFFLTELYSTQDYSERDAQFARIASTIDKLFPQRVGRLALSLAQLHALTEDLDCAMGQAWADLATTAPQTVTLPPSEQARRYVSAWRRTSRRSERERQLTSVLDIGQELAQLTRTPGLRTLLRMMRGPAKAAGLVDLQRFLESGFDTFASLNTQSGDAEAFLRQIEARESALLALLFDADVTACETSIAQSLQTPPPYSPCSPLL